MIKTQLLKYIKASIEDGYAMDVLYYCIKDAALKNGLAFETATSVVIDGRFLGETIQIGISNRFQSQIKTVALLLSIRALMLDKDYLKCCADDNLIFTSSVIGKFQWVELTTIIRECMDDDEFYRLYNIFEDVYFDECVTEEALTELKDGLKVPEYRGLEKYYKSIASTNKEVYEDVICDNAYVNEDFETYTVPDNIAYIGNTAFSYCTNLSMIKFSNKVSFGVFPIIECNKLNRIFVPTELVDYFKEELPYYKSIITDKENGIGLLNEETITENNKGKRWTVAEEEKVKHFFGLGHSVKAIANVMGRTEIAIKARLGKLGLIDYTYSKDDKSDTITDVPLFKKNDSLKSEKETRQEKSDKILDSLMETMDSIPEEKEQTVTSQYIDLGDAISRAKSFTAPEQYLNFFKSYSVSASNAFEILVTTNNIYAVFVMIKIMGDPKIQLELGWNDIDESLIKSIKKLAAKYNYSKEIYSFLFPAIRDKKCPLKKIGNIEIEKLDFQSFKTAFEIYLDKIAKPKIKSHHSTTASSGFSSSKGWITNNEEWSSKRTSYRSVVQPQKEKDELYEKFEYGLSDW
jgi:hypothetical protein